MKYIKNFFVMLFFISLASPVNALENENVDVIVEVVYLDQNTSTDDLVLDDGSILSEYNYQIIYPKLRINTTLGIYFNSVAWITRDGLLSLSLYPKTTVRNSITTKETAWNVLSNTNVGFGYDLRFSSNKATLKQQYDCHFFVPIANVKTYWNLEPSKPYTDLITLMLTGCNNK